MLGIINAKVISKGRYGRTREITVSTTDALTPQVLQALAQDLRGGNDSPQPVRRVAMPKPDGRHRPRGMPTGRDRVGHQAGTSVIEPLCAATCPDTSDGCRPQRRATQAVQGVKAQRVSHG